MHSSLLRERHTAVYSVAAAVLSSSAKAGSESLKTKEEAAKAADMDPARSDAPAEGNKRLVTQTV